MPTLIAPLDYKVRRTVAERLNAEFGLTVPHIFQIALNVWDDLSEPDVNLHYESICDQLIRFPHLQHLNYGDFMLLMNIVVPIIHSFHDCLSSDMDSFVFRSIPFKPQISVVKMMPGAILMNVH